uniref:Uncharacterized protein n=1 Tax=Rhizophora mucronata TaxID=61149 RepID=A0A2P2IST5_RHIMU
MIQCILPQSDEKSRCNRFKSYSAITQRTMKKPYFDHLDFRST